VAAKTVAGLRRRVVAEGGWLVARRRRKAATALAANGSVAAVTALAEAVAVGRDDTVIGIAQAALSRIPYGPSVDAVCGVWAKTRSGVLAASTSTAAMRSESSPQLNAADHARRHAWMPPDSQLAEIAVELSG
jgi:hypothetical protein